MAIATKLPQRPSMPSCHVDWYSATAKVSSEQGQEALSVELQNRLARWAAHGTPTQVPWHWQRSAPHHGYRAAVREEGSGAAIEWAGTEEQGLHLVLPGKACSALSAAHEDWLRRMRSWLGKQAPVLASRVDWALNSEDLLPTYFILGRRRENSTGNILPGPTVRTRLITPARVAETDAPDGRTALTVYFGSRSGGTFVRVYDKARQLAGRDISEVRRLAPWYRLEYELHDETADKSIDAYECGGWPHVAGYLSQRLALVVPQGNDSNQSRWPLHPAFARAMGECVPTPPAPSTRQKTSLDERLEWLQGAAGRTLAEATDEYGWEAVSDYLQGAVALYRARHPAEVSTTPT